MPTRKRIHCADCGKYRAHQKYSRCYPCWLAYIKEHKPAEHEEYIRKGREAYNRNTSPDKRRHNKVKILCKHYNISVSLYDKLAKKGCGVCGGFVELCFDHDHETNAFRGLLCRRCNMGLGLIGDTKEAIQRTLQYLERTYD